MSRASYIYGFSELVDQQCGYVVRILSLIALIGSLSYPLTGLGQTPHLSGTVDIDMAGGMLSGDVCLSDLPEEDTLRFVLNHALTVASVYSVEGKQLRYSGYHGGRMVGEGLLYSTSDSLRDAGTLCVRYTGAVPVYNVADSLYNVFDYKGWIAHNGRTLRATEQSKWYPVPYEPDTERLDEAMSYRLRIRCPDCKSIYVNGAAPGRGPEMEAATDLPYEPLLFAGQYDFSDFGGTLYLNSDISPEAAAVLSAKVEEIKGFYEELLSVPYGDSLVFLEHEAVERFDPHRSWGFVTWPTIAYAGSKISRLVSGDSLGAPWVWRFVAHEMGHYYFGTLLRPGGPYRWFLLESVPEYLALKAVAHFVGEETYREMLTAHYEAVAKEPALPRLDRITEAAAIDDRYRYRYGPLLLLALEHEIGKDRIADFLRTLLKTPHPSKIDYLYLSRTAREVGVPSDAWHRFERDCVQKTAEASCLKELLP